MHTIELLTLLLTIPGVMLSIFVLAHWYKPATAAFLTREGRDSADWMLIGVFVAFLGAVPDNVWWGIYWTLRSMELMPEARWFQAKGIFINLPFRQLALIVAAYCHLRAACISTGRGVRGLNYLLWASLGVGVIVTGVLKYAYYQ